MRSLNESRLNRKNIDEMYLYCIVDETDVFVLYRVSFIDGVYLKLKFAFFKCHND